MSIIDITDESFQHEVLESSKPVLVDVHMESGCGPCRAVAPKIAEIANDLSEEIKVVKLDYLQNREIVKRFTITSFPTLLIFWSGGLRGLLRGNQPMEAVQKWVGQHVSEYTAGEQRRLEAQQRAEAQKGPSA